uniref:Novel immune-type receptor 12 n=1 Tax=Sinocyclocheilus grahami TaxID=75366 RepID=A0A672QWS2_SINGR
CFKSIFVLFLEHFIVSLLTAVKSSQIVNLSAQPGENVTIWCQHTSETGINIHWFKQTNSSVPIAIVYMMISYQLKEIHKMYLNGFQQDRLLMTLNSKNSSLRILNVDVSDCGLYFCGWESRIIAFGDGTHLDIKGNLKEKCKSSYDPFNPGDSVNLHCSVLTKKCVGNHSVYWFKHESGDTHPGIIYKHGNMNDQCEKTSEKDSHVQSFIYNLPKKNLGLSDAGTYYCAVVTCGEILFGNGSRLEIGGEKNAHDRSNHILIAVFSETTWTDLKVPVLVATNILWLVIIAILLCKRVQKRQETFSGKSFPYQEYSLMTRDVTINLHKCSAALFSAETKENALSATCWQRVNRRLIQLVCCFCFMRIFFMHSFTLCYLFI